MSSVLIIFAHPALQSSNVNRRLIEVAREVPGVRIHDLYEQYPDFHVDVKHEQQAMLEAKTIIFQHPMYWYSSPALLKEWLDVVLTRGWAYGTGGEALKGKNLMSVISTGGPQASYQKDGSNHYTITELLYPFDQTARLCGMKYQSPLVFHSARLADAKVIAQHALEYERVLKALLVSHA